MSAVTVAIAGATGQLGSKITRAFLSSSIYPSQVAHVKVLTRDITSNSTKALTAIGAEAISIANGVSAEALKGVDVFINALGHETPAAVKNSYAKAAVEAGVKVYIASEYGVDHGVIGFEHELFQNKQDHVKYTRDVSGGRIKIISPFVGFFLEGTIAPWFGFDTKNKLYKSLGDPNTRFTLTSLDDIASAVVRLSVLAAADPASVPDYVRISGDSKSFSEIAAIVGKESGEKIEVQGADFEESKRKLVGEAQGKGFALEYLKLAIASGTVDFTAVNNENELVNPSQSLWKWKTVEDYAKEVKGRPFVD